MDYFRLLTFTHELLKIFIYLHITFGVEKRLAEEQWLEEELNIVKFFF
jgi:hypothetical protein